jgi:putative two-component system hydrogenase maturation factor HypX/HoxX
MRGSAGEIIAQRHGAICRATVDGAVWITHLKEHGPESFKLPAMQALERPATGSTRPRSQCRRLRAAYLSARSRRQTKVVVLQGGSDFFSNGIHLNVIDASVDPGAESWRNLHAPRRRRPRHHRNRLAPRRLGARRRRRGPAACRSRWRRISSSRARASC